jgi:diacylglycerol kinase family enzyme
MRTLLIINPYSRSGRSAIYADKAMKYLESRNFDFEYKFISDFDDAFMYSSKANSEGIENIVAVGGDGTINKVINGFFDREGNKISGSRFGVIYTGTSPDFCRSYDIPTDYRKAADVIINQQCKDIPIGMIKFCNNTDGENSADVRFFACCANIGLGASLARKANSGIRARVGDFLGTLISLIQILSKYKGTDYEVRLGDEIRTYRNSFNISVGLTKYIASGIKVAHKGHENESKFYVLAAGNVKASNLPKFLWRIYSGKEFVNSDMLSLVYSDTVEISFNAEHPDIEFDGDPAGYLPCIIQLTKAKLPLLQA